MRRWDHPRSRNMNLKTHLQLFYSLQLEKQKETTHLHFSEMSWYLFFLYNKQKRGSESAGLLLRFFCTASFFTIIKLNFHTFDSYPVSYLPFFFRNVSRNLLQLDPRTLRGTLLESFRSMHLDTSTPHHTEEPVRSFFLHYVLSDSFGH